MNEKQPSITDSIKEQAGYWLVRQNSGNWSAKDEHGFRQWLAENSLHRQAFEEVQDLWRGLDQFKSTHTQSTLSKPQGQPYKPKSRWFISAIGASLTVFGLTILSVDSTILIPSEKIYSTVKGEQSTITLADGSEISLNTDTEVNVRYKPFSRQIVLNHGEAAFNVAHESFRRFTVHAGNGQIIDIGTRFNVNQTPERVVVTVTEGAVEVQTGQQSMQPLVAGQRISYSHDGLLSLPDHPDLLSVTAWQQGQIFFDMTPLSEITAQLSRYHPVKFVFDDAKLKRLKMSGTFTTRDLTAFLNTLETIYPLRAQLGNDQTVHLKNAAQR